METSTDEIVANHDQLRNRARDLASSLASSAETADASEALHEPTRTALAESGLAGLTVPSKFGGSGGEAVDPLAIAIVREQLMYESAHLDGLFAMQGIGSYGLSTAGSERLQQEWLPRVASLDAIAALALTEPEVGSDLRAISTAIEEDGDHIRVSGHKAFITNAGAADFYVVLGREGEGYSLVFVPADWEGVRVTSGPNLIAPHILGEVEFDVLVPSDHRIGEPGKAFRLVLSTLAMFRVSVGGAAVGLAQAALDECLEHTQQRKQFGRPLAELGSISQGLALSWCEIEAARALTYRAAKAAQNDPFASLDLSSMAKVIATETAGRVVDRSVQSMGRFGIITGSKIERLYRNARPLRIYEGATEVLLDSLSRRLLREGTRA